MVFLTLLRHLGLGHWDAVKQLYLPKELEKK
jgi:hypothetical protein